MHADQSLLGSTKHELWMKVTKMGVKGRESLDLKS